MMRTSNFSAAVAIGFLLSLFSSVSLMASESIELTDRDGKTNLQAFRDDGKFTLVLLRYHECSVCDHSETDMQQWYKTLDLQNVSALIINIDDADMHEAVNVRQSNAGVTITSYFAKSSPGFNDAFKEITGNTFKVVPHFILFGPDGEFIAESMGYRMNWQDLTGLIKRRS